MKEDIADVKFVQEIIRQKRNKHNVKLRNPWKTVIENKFWREDNRRLKKTVLDQLTRYNMKLSSFLRHDMLPVIKLAYVMDFYFVIAN